MIYTLPVLVCQLRVCQHLDSASALCDWQQLCTQCMQDGMQDEIFFSLPLAYVYSLRRAADTFSALKQCAKQIFCKHFIYYILLYIYIYYSLNLPWRSYLSPFYLQLPEMRHIRPRGSGKKYPTNVPILYITSQVCQFVLPFLRGLLFPNHFYK